MERQAGLGVPYSAAPVKEGAEGRCHHLSHHQVSPDGSLFPVEPGAFKAEALAQAQDLYCSRDMGADTHYLRHLDRQAPENVRDTLDLATLVRQA